MKEGAGTDPFGSTDDNSAADDQDDDNDAADEVLDEKREGEPLADNAAPEVGTESNGSVAPELPQAERNEGGVPWVYTRSNVKQDRDMVQFYLRGAVQDAEGDLVDAVEDELGTSVSKTDVREAAVVAAMRRPEIVAEELERWGFESE